MSWSVLNAMMARVRGFALVLAVLAASAIAAPAHLVTASGCDTLAPLVRGAGDAIQNDAYSGRDAGDGPAGAVRLPREGYSWGWLDPPADGLGGDREDWYSFPLAAAPDHVVMVEVNATPLYLSDYVLRLEDERRGAPDPATAWPDALRYRMEAWAPGATSATFVGKPNSKGGENVTFVALTSGLWHFRVTQDALAESPTGCERAADSLGVAGAPLPVADYGVYFGCSPFCKRAIIA